MASTVGDRLGDLSFIVNVPWDFTVMRFLCFTCSREFERSPSAVGDEERREALIEEGIEALIYVRQDSRTPWIGLVLPLLSRFQIFCDHMLHEIRPEIDCRYWGKPVEVHNLSRPVQVQNVSAFRKTPLADISFDAVALRCVGR